MSLSNHIVLSSLTFIQSLAVFQGEARYRDGTGAGNGEVPLDIEDFVLSKRGIVEGRTRSVSPDQRNLVPRE